MEDNIVSQPATKGDLNGLEMKIQSMLDKQTEHIGREFRLALEQSESHLRSAKLDQLSTLEGDVHKLKIAVFGEADRAPYDQAA